MELARTDLRSPLSLARAITGSVPPKAASTTVTAAQSGAAQAVGPAAGSGWKTASDMRLLVGSDAATQSIVDAIEGAEDVVNVAIYAMRDESPGSGKAIGDALVAQARRGVEVNVALDRAGGRLLEQDAASHAFVERLRSAGADVRVMDAPLSPDKARRYFDHRKLVIADGKTAVVGGMNFYGGYDHFYDTMVRFDGPAAAQPAQQFAERWQRLGGTVSEANRRTMAAAAAADVPASANRHVVKTLVNAPDVKTFEASDFLVDSFRSAKDRIWLTTPNITSPELVDELALAAERGVDVRVITNSGDLAPSKIRLYGRSFYPKLIGSGARVYEIPQSLHAKNYLIDDVAVVGSFNLTNQSYRRHHEVITAIKEGPTINQVEDLFRFDFKRSHLVGTETLAARGQKAMNIVRRFGLRRI